MKNIFLVAALLICAYSYGQNAALSFCTYVNNISQECVFENTKFITTPDSTHAKLYMFFRMRIPFGTNRLTYKIYSIDRFGKEIFLREVYQDVQTEWLVAWQPETFVSPGKYVIHVFRGAEEITSNGFEFYNN